MKIPKPRQKVEQLHDANTPDPEMDGAIVPGRPRNADPVQSVAVITEAVFRAFWRSPSEKFEVNDGATVWAVSALWRLADFFDGMDVQEQAKWVDEHSARTIYTNNSYAGYVTLMDTWARRAHPLLQPVLRADDRRAADLAWEQEDVKGHGTERSALRFSAI